MTRCLPSGSSNTFTGHQQHCPGFYHLSPAGNSGSTTFSIWTDPISHSEICS